MSLPESANEAKLYELHDKVTVGNVVCGGNLSKGDIGFIIEKCETGYLVAEGSNLGDALINQYDHTLSSWYGDCELTLTPKTEIQLELNFGAI